MNNFFETLNGQLRGNYTLQFTVKKKDELLTVMVRPKFNTDEKSGKIVDEVPPLIITGTPSELDSQFLFQLTSPLNLANTLQTNIDEFSKSLLKATEKSTEAPKESATKPKRRNKKEEDKKLAEEAAAKLAASSEAEKTEESPFKADAVTANQSTAPVVNDNTEPGIEQSEGNLMETVISEQPSKKRVIAAAPEIPVQQPPVQNKEEDLW